MIHDAPSPNLPVNLAALAHAAAEHRYERKLLVCRRMGVGRELLRTLTVRGTSWVNFEVTTPRQLAHELMAAELAVQGLVVADEFDELALLDAAIDEVLEGAGGRLAELAEGTGLRQAVANSVRALRLAGIGAPQLDRARFRDEDKRAQIARILDTYERRLGEGGRKDGAGVMRGAIAALGAGSAVLGAGGARLDAGRVYVLPGQSTRGLPGQLLELLLERGAELLPTEPVYGIAPPNAWLVPTRPVEVDALRAGASPLAWLHDPAGWSRAAKGADVTRAEAAAADASGDVVTDLFAATSVSAELREVLRRVMAAGLQWDEVEIVATDARVYGVALDGIAQRLGVPVSYAAGLPIARTRPGRAVAKYLEWVEQGFPADVLRQMLERGDVAAADGAASGTALARRLRSLRIGRGRDRYETALGRRERIIASVQSPEDERTAEEFADDRARERAEVAALAAVVRPLLKATPRVPERLGGPPVFVAPADLAGALLVLLGMVPAMTSVDRTAKARLQASLERLAHSVTRPTTLPGAVAVLMSKLADSVPAPDAEGGSPWTSSGGHLHLSDLEHGGHAGRRATFIVGLDSGRFPGGGGSDALLVDDDRRRLTAGQSTPALPTAAERIEERRHAFAALVSRLRGRVTFSYATWDAVEGRAIAPAAELLQVLRLQRDDVTADYDALHRAVAPAASAVPRASALLDADDVWLHALAHGGGGAHGYGALRRGVRTVRDAYPGLNAGVIAWKARLHSPAPTAYHGFVEARPQLDPRENALRVVSPTQLQTLGACAHRYLMRYVLRLKKPDDPVTSPEQWLPPIEKGSLLHAVYERALTQAVEDDVAIDSDDFEDLVLELLDDGIADMREQLAPPGGAVFEAECAALVEDARAFIAMVREDVDAGHVFEAFERTFGREAGSPSVPIELPDGRTVQLAGAIDRVDRLEDGRLVIIDYKTGSAYRYGGRSGTYDGGRRLQHVLYTAAAERLFGAQVERVEYQFPSRRAENHRAAYARSELSDGLGKVTELLDLVARGWFVPTNDPDDCKFCDFANACRVRVDPYGKVDSPLAGWSRELKHDAADALRRVRR